LRVELFVTLYSSVEVARNSSCTLFRRSVVGSRCTWHHIDISLSHLDVSYTSLLISYNIYFHLYNYMYIYIYICISTLKKKKCIYILIKIWKKKSESINNSGIHSKYSINNTSIIDYISPVAYKQKARACEQLKTNIYGKSRF